MQPDGPALAKRRANHVALTPLSFLARAADVFADRPAVIEGDRIFTYAAFATRARRLAHALTQNGIKRGDTVAIKYFFDLSHQVQLFFLKHDVHKSFLYQPDAMLATDGAAKFFYQLKQGPKTFVHLLIFKTIGYAFFFYSYMQVAIAGMTETNGFEIIFYSQCLHSPYQRR